MTAAEQPASRRRMLAEIALQDAPVPSAVQFREGGNVTLQFDTLADATPWARLIGAEVETYDNENGCTYFRDAFGSWLGWSVLLWASEPTVPIHDALDDETRAALGKITAAAE